MTAIPKPFAAICFDCDSTLSSIEGIDELAAQAGVLDEIAPLTTAAMDGTIALDQIYAKRLELIRPDKPSMDWLAKRYINDMVDGAAKTIAALIQTGKSVHIISGGLRQAILPLAHALNVPIENVHAVDICFNPDGSYKDFDTSSPLITPGGKADICRNVVAAHGTTAMIGDGLTDLAARNAGAYVIGFGGVERRQIVVDGADQFIDTPDLTATLDILLTTNERDALNHAPRT